jgi:hypothetical protein
MRRRFAGLVVLASLSAPFAVAPPGAASPGGLDSYGGHHCRTNCARYGLRRNRYHCHRNTARCRRSLRRHRAHGH